MVENILISHFQSGDLPAVSLLVGDRRHLKELVKDFLKHVWPKDQGTISSDLYWFEGSQLGVDEAREIRRRFVWKGGGKSGRFFIVDADVITPEAQNALLKTLEEVSEKTFFIILVDNARKLLPTVLSRVCRFSLPTTNIISVDPIRFVTGTPIVRIREVSKLRDNADRAGSREAINAWLAELETFFASKLASNPVDNDYQQAVREIVRVRRWFGRRGSSDRLLLEHLALVLPKI